ncbi:phage major capsid protein [Paraburkholderia atlantica]|uniref:phage major capsid protein n=1 Tax=Paraburkholderia atlantica TaxID=2654982 RepID=UPI00160F3318|nr:phage major capsid protein [Paraburkholderia atlantica]MBB5506712.1 HK97 family phage major capsid protein [Paraburkholderia atlantica]
MQTNNSNQVPRGIKAVYAHGGTPDINAVINGLSTAFASFKGDNQAKLSKIEADLSEFQAAIDEHSIKLAAAQMFGGGAVNLSPDGTVQARLEQQPIHAARGLRSAQISAHYMRRAQAAGEDTRLDIGDFMRGIAGLQCSDSVRASLAEGQDKTGGFAVPNSVMPRILDAMVDQSALLGAGAGILPIDTGAKSVTVAAIDVLPKPAWRLEAGGVAETDPTFRGVIATPRSLACIVRISRELLADADDVSRAIIQAISQAFALEFDRVGLVGSGTAPEPLGLYGMANVKKIQQAGEKLTYADVLAAYQAQLEASAPAPTAAIMAPRSLVGLAGLVDTLGQPLNAPSLLDGVRRLSTNGVPTNLGDRADKSLAFIGDFSTVQFALREALTIGRLNEAYAKTGEIGFLCHARVDVIANYPQAITVIEGVAS